MSGILAKVGLTTPADQIGFVISVGGGGFVTIQAFRRARVLHRFVNESDEMLKDIIAARFRLTESEIRGASQYLKYYRSRGKWFSIVPISFMAFELGSNLLKKFKFKN